MNFFFFFSQRTSVELAYTLSPPTPYTIFILGHTRISYILCFFTIFLGAETTALFIFFLSQDLILKCVHLPFSNSVYLGQNAKLKHTFLKKRREKCCYPFISTSPKEKSSPFFFGGWGGAVCMWNYS